MEERAASRPDQAPLVAPLDSDEGGAKYTAPVTSINSGDADDPEPASKIA